MGDFSQELALQIPRLRRYARALTHNASWADDLVQDTLERALRRRWLFRMPGNLASWLMTILYRLYLNDLARHRRKPEESLDEALPEAGRAAGDDTLLDMQRALAKLSVDHRAVIVLIGLEQVSYQEAAAILGVPVGTVMSRLTRARSHLRAILSGQAEAGAAAPIHLSRVK